MSEPGETPPEAQNDLRPGPLVLWGIISAFVVLGSFHVLHELMSHAAAVPSAGLVGVVVGAVGYRWGGGTASARGAGFTAALGGGLGLLALHVLPLLH